MIDSRFMSSPDLLARTPSPPYYAVIFTSWRTEGDRGYTHMADRMVELARQQPAEHQTAQCAGQRTWYVDYQVRVALVERDYGK
jgi:hypothetical protein